jgi:SAM-dependent methyltransferase
MADVLFEDAFLSQVYDAWHPRAVRDDYNFYLPYIMGAGGVLDAGCGTGTLLAEARRNGHGGRLCGLDPASGMIGVARRHPGIEWVKGELKSAPWQDAFDLVVMTGHAFQAIVTDADLLASVQAVARLLLPGGRFAFEIRNPAARAWERWCPENARTVICPDGTEVRIMTTLDREFDGDTVIFTHRFEGQHPSLPRASRSTLRFLDAIAVRNLLQQAGFQVQYQFGDFDGGPLSTNSEEIITVAQVDG